MFKNLKKISGIYKITNIFNNKVYIGKAKNIYLRCKKGHYNLLKRNQHRNNHLQSSWNKYKEKMFIFEILEEYEFNRELLNKREIYWIEFYNSNNPQYGYNKTKGGDGGLGRHYIMSEETKNKIRITCKKYKLTEEQHQKLIDSVQGEKNGFYGKNHKEEIKKHLSNIRKEKGLAKGKNNGMYNKKVYDIWVEKYGEEIAKIKHQQMIEKQKLTKKQNQSNIGEKNGMYGKKLNEQSRKKISEKVKEKLTPEKYKEIVNIKKYNRALKLKQNILNYYKDYNKEILLNLLDNNINIYGTKKFGKYEKNKQQELIQILINIYA